MFISKKYQCYIVITFQICTYNVIYFFGDNQRKLHVMLALY